MIENNKVMTIVGIFEPYIYSIKFDNEESDEYSRLLEEWSDMEKVKDFFERNKSYMSDYMSKCIKNFYEAAEQVSDEADALEYTLCDLYENTQNGIEPDFDSFFKPLDGLYSLSIDYMPTKSYGNGRPPLIRMYAIKIISNVYVITDGGIKIAKKIQESPELKDHVFKKINQVREFLKFHNIISSEDLKTYCDE